MKVRNEIVIEKSAKEVWEIMGNQFAEIHIWASYFIESKAVGESKFNGISFSARETVVKGGENTHTLDIFDSENYILSYTVTTGAPPFANKAEAQWAIEIINEHSCSASIAVIMDLKEMIPTDKAKEISEWLSESANGMLEELKHFTETGTVHPRKLKA